MVDINSKIHHECKALSEAILIWKGDTNIDSVDSDVERNTFKMYESIYKGYGPGRTISVGMITYTVSITATYIPFEE